MDQAGRLTRKNLNKTALCETAQHRTKQHLLKSQFSPARHDLGAQAQRAAEALGCSHGLLGGLTVDVEHAREGEDKVATLRQRHVSFSQSADSKATTSSASRGRTRRARSSPDRQDAQCAPLL